MHSSAIAAISVLSTVAVLGGIAAAVYFTWPKETTGGQVRLIGNFTILNRTVEETSDSSICSYLRAIIWNEKLATYNCTIIDKRPGSVRVRYSLEINVTSNAEDTLRKASEAIASNSSDARVFLIDQSSVTFEDTNGVVQNYCSIQGLCQNANTICISVVGNYDCVCRVGYVQSSQGCVDVTEDRFCKPTNTWIPMTKVCDKYQDCSDDSDEINCKCDTTSQYGCLNGRCIYKEWLCDGVKDCPQGDDEMPPQCSECNSIQFQCRSYHECISSSDQCNGRSDCEDSSDESHCIALGESSLNNSGVHLLRAIYRGLPGYYVCSDGWNASWSDSVCTHMGYGKAVATSSEAVNGSFLSLDPSQSPSANFMAFLNISNCSSQNAVGVSCANLECGKRAVLSDSVGPYILNGQRAVRGAWPWQVIVYTGRIVSGSQFQLLSICGGSLLGDRWVLTAAHCARVDGSLGATLGYTGNTRPENLLIILGTISRIDNPDTIKMTVDQVFVHPSYNGEDFDNDVALLRLSHPVTLGETIQPICLPDPNEDLSRFRVCVDTGFGNTLRNSISNDLLQARMNIMSGSNCAMYNRILRDKTQLCIGTLSNTQDINICSGDSGGPLSCQDENGAWIVIGVNSYVTGNGNTDEAKDVCQLSVVARVTAFLGWFLATMSSNSI